MRGQEAWELVWARGPLLPPSKGGRGLGPRVFSPDPLRIQDSEKQMRAVGDAPLQPQSHFFFFFFW
jgi:hypothetical protein